MSVPYPTPTSPLYKLACDFIRAANNKDFAGVDPLMAPEGLTQLWPSTLRQPGHEKPADNKSHMERGKVMFETFMGELNVDIEHPVNVVEGKDVIVLQLSSAGKLKSGTPFNQEYLHIFRFNDDHKIIYHDEWMDSAYAMQAFSAGAGVMPKFDEHGKVINQDEGEKALKAGDSGEEATA